MISVGVVSEKGGSAVQVDDMDDPVSAVRVHRKSASTPVSQALAAQSDRRSSWSPCQEPEPNNTSRLLTIGCSDTGDKWRVRIASPRLSTEIAVWTHLNHGMIVARFQAASVTANAHSSS